MSGTITAVEPKSLGARVGLRPGDVLVAINGQTPRDVIDVQFYSAEPDLSLEIRRGEKTFTIDAKRRYTEPFGLTFAHPTFDTDIRRCENRCEFCFVTQMPPRLRRSLYVKDDDYRHSFLFGNYVTLTNLTHADWERLEEQVLSPLYVSVQATENDLRRRLLRNPKAPDVLLQLDRLAQIGIDIHTQIVLVPGVNDGTHLDRSIADLAERHPAVLSVSVVPVGLTRFHRGGCHVYARDEMRAVFDQVTDWQARLAPTLGARFAYLSDEWYLRLGEEVPPLDAYDGFDLTENGVGLVRRFLEEWDESALGRVPSTLVTGTLFEPTLQRVTAHLPGIDVVAVLNRFFGETVTVAGLLTGQDVIAQLRDRPLGERVILPEAMFGGPEGQTLDEMRPADIGEALGREVVTSLSA
jgi:putative radical SAM enzyme (TIGR03279 family)